MRFCLLFTLLNARNANRNGGFRNQFRKCRVLKTGENGGFWTVEKKNVLYCRFHQRILRFSKYNRWKRVKKYVSSNEKRISVHWWKQNENASVYEDILFRLLRDQKGDLVWKRNSMAEASDKTANWIALDVLRV